MLQQITKPSAQKFGLLLDFRSQDNSDNFKLLPSCHFAFQSQEFKLHKNV